jgi:hypothetical protein
MSERPAGPRTRALESLALAAVVAFAFWIRVHDITAFRIGPDDGNYLNSARIHAIERGGSILDWLRADAAWMRELARLYDDANSTYQHSYLHQLTARWLYRLGFGALESLRWSSALNGTLTVLVVAWLVRRLLPARRWLAILAAAFVALSPLLAFLSRTGWGQAGMTCWYLAFLVCAHRALVERPEPDARTLRRAALGMIATSLLAFGWHEGVAPYVAGTALAALAAPWIRGEAWSARAALASRRWWTYFAGASVVGALTLALLLSPFAQDVWFNALGRAPEGTSWFQLKGLTLQNLFVQQRPDLLITWPMLALALAGAVWLRRVDRPAFRWLLANAIAGPALLFLFFGDAWLLRAHLPSIVLLLVFAACGVAWVIDRLGHAAGVVVGCTVIALTAATTWSSLFGRHLGPLFLQKLYDQTNQLDHRHVDEAMYDLLQREIEPGDAVGVWGDKACLFRLLDRGIPAREDYMENRPTETWPRWVVGVPAGKDGFERSRFFDARGGPYRLRAKDNVGRHALYER